MTTAGAVKAGAGAVLLVVAIGLAEQQLSPGHSAGAGHIQVIRDGGNDPSAVGVWATVLVQPSAQGLFGYDAGGMAVYARAHICAASIDGGVDPGSLLPGMTIVSDDTTTDACASTAPALEAWADGIDGGAPWPCACARDATCHGPDGGTAALSVTLQPGWSGSGCRPKACVELMGTSSWPSECP